jgi:hypothetical protein
MDLAAVLIENGERSMRALWRTTGALGLDESCWSSVARSAVFADVDAPDDLAVLGQIEPDG